MAQFGVMIEISDIQDPKSLETWLTDWPRENGLDKAAIQAVAVSVAYRAAMRVLPVWWHWTLTKAAQKHDLTALPILRCCLISGVAAKMPTPEIRNAAAAAIADAAAAATDAAAAAHAAIADATDFWASVQIDCHLISENGDLFAAPLWGTEMSSLAPIWQDVKKQDIGAEWSFWIKWYDDVLAGRRQDWSLLEKIALIDSEIWDAGPGAVAKEIEKISAKHSRADSDDLAAANQALPSAPTTTIAVVQQAMTRNRAELPPTYEAIESLILLEIERLQTKNYRDDDDKNEAIQQVRTYITLYEAIAQMRTALPVSGPVTEKHAEKTEALWRVYAKKLRTLPREKVDEVAEGVWETGKGATQFGLIGGSAYLATQLGLPVISGVAVGALCFAPKKAGDIIKSAKDWLPKASS